LEKGGGEAGRETVGSVTQDQVREIAKNDNMVAINSAVSVDFAGQIAAESIGPRVISGAGGQTSFAIGSFLSNGGRSVTVMTSTAGSGDRRVSRITPMLAEGSIVTVPRTISDYFIVFFKPIITLKIYPIRRVCQN